jgi:hypothetical protein
MKEKLKNYLGVAIIAALLILSAAAWNYSRSFSKSIEQSVQHSFVVTAEGRAVAIPDVAKFTFSVITEGGKDVASLQKENSQKSNRIIDFVKNQGIDTKDIKTVAYNLSPRYQTCYLGREGSLCPPAEIVGYTINQSVEVKVRDFSKIGDILGGVVERGANSVSQLQFTIDDPTALQNQARNEAISKARAKARAIAAAGGFSLGRILSIDESSDGLPPIYFAKAEAPLFKSESSPAIEAGSTEVTVRVSLRFEMK